MNGFNFSNVGEKISGLLFRRFCFLFFSKHKHGPLLTGESGLSGHLGLFIEFFVFDKMAWLTGSPASSCAVYSCIHLINGFFGISEYIENLYSRLSTEVYFKG